MATSALVVLVAVLLIAFRIALARAPAYARKYRLGLGERTHLAIEFGAMDARWRFYGPELVFDDAVVRSQDRRRTFVRARRVSLAFGLWTAISTGRLAAGRISLEAPELQAVRTLDGRYEFVGQGELPERDRSEAFEPDNLPTGRVSVINASVGFRDLKTGRGPWIVPGVSFEFRRSAVPWTLMDKLRFPLASGNRCDFPATPRGKLAEAQDSGLAIQTSMRATYSSLAGRRSCRMTGRRRDKVTDLFKWRALCAARVPTT